MSLRALFCVVVLGGGALACAPGDGDASGAVNASTSAVSIASGANPVIDEWRVVRYVELYGQFDADGANVTGGHLYCTLSNAEQRRREDFGALIPVYRSATQVNFQIGIAIELNSWPFFRSRPTSYDCDLVVFENGNEYVPAAATSFHVDNR